jgi:hypothetical protein
MFLISSLTDKTTSMIVTPSITLYIDYNCRNNEMGTFCNLEGICLPIMAMAMYIDTLAGTPITGAN